MSLLAFKQECKKLKLTALLRERFMNVTIDLQHFQAALEEIGIQTNINNLISSVTYKLQPNKCVPELTNVCWNVFQNLNIDQLAKVEQLLML